ncbi:MAG: selenocysteine-specific translation elongation factor [Polyangiaceae bacterium]
MSSLARRIVIATAGHVDHGKTTLVRALTGTDTDRLPDEKRRGISIELGFATLAHAPLSFIDVPGHKKLVHAMIAGVGGVDGVLLVVAADDAVMPQTREHLHVCKLLGIERIVVALSKADLVDDETLELARADLDATLGGMGLQARAVVPTAATTGKGLPELEAALLAMAAEAPAAADDERVWLPVDRVFSVKGAGTVVTGTLTRGSLRVGEAVYVGSASGLHASSCRSIEVHGQQQDHVHAPSRVAINLAKLERADVVRGNVVTNDPALPITRRLEVKLELAPGVEGEVESGFTAQVYVGTERRIGRVTLLGASGAHLALDEALPAIGGVGYVLRGFKDSRERGAVLGGGRILDAAPAVLPRRRDAARWEGREQTLRALAEGRVGDALLGLITAAAPRAVDIASLEPRLGRPAGELTKLVEARRKKGSLVAIGNGDQVTTPDNVTNLERRLVARVDAHHRQAPHEPGLSLETARTHLSRVAGRRVSEAVLERAAARGQVVVDQGVVCTPEFAKASGPGARAREAKVLEALGAVALDGTTETLLASKLGEDVERIKVALAALARAERARRLGTLWFAESSIDSVRARVAKHFDEAEELSVPQLKDLCGISRKQAIPILEQLDREGTTRRRGDARLRGPGRRR